MDQHAANILIFRTNCDENSLASRHSSNSSALLCVASFTRGQGRIVEAADIIVVHGRVYTEDPKQPWAQAVAIYAERSLRRNRSRN